jgi:hypothetical protein
LHADAHDPAAADLPELQYPIADAPTVIDLVTLTVTGIVRSPSALTPLHDVIELPLIRGRRTARRLGFDQPREFSVRRQGNQMTCNI